MARKRRARKTEPQAVARPKTRNAGFTWSRNLVIGVVLGVTFLAFGNSLFNGFAYDDNTQILESELIRSFSNLPKALVTDVWFWRVEQDKDPTKQAGPSTPYYRPVFIVYLMVGWHMFGASPFGWHLASILMHMLAVYLAFLIMERITGDYKLSGLAALLFAVHPLRSESVAWISGITDPLLAVFMLSALFYYMRYRAEGALKLFAISQLLFLLAIFAKEPAVCAPMMVVAYELFFINKNTPFKARLQSGLVHASGFIGISIFYFAMRQRAIGFLLADPNFSPHSTSASMLTMPLAVVKYLGLLLLPIDLSLFHYTPLVNSVLSLRFILPAAVLAGLVILSKPLWKSTASRFALLWFSINLLPVLNLTAFSEDHLIQERYIYVPSIGFSLLLAIGLLKLPEVVRVSIPKRRAAVTTAAALLTIVLAMTTMAQNVVWKDDVTLWTHGVEVAPDQRAARYILGFYYLQHQQYERAADQFEEYMRLHANSMIVVTNLASTHLLLYQAQATINRTAADRSHLDRAIALCEKGLAVVSAGPLWDTLGTCYTFDTELKNLDRALACYDRGLGVDPENAMIMFHKGATLVKKGDYDHAMTFLDRARQQEPNLSDIYKVLAYCYQAKGQLQDAIQNFSLYLQQQPNAFDASKVSQDIQTLRLQMQKSAQQS